MLRYVDNKGRSTVFASTQDMLELADVLARVDPDRDSLVIYFKGKIYYKSRAFLMPNPSCAAAMRLISNAVDQGKAVIATNHRTHSGVFLSGNFAPGRLSLPPSNYYGQSWHPFWSRTPDQFADLLNNLSVADVVDSSNLDRPTLILPKHQGLRADGSMAEYYGFKYFLFSNVDGDPWRITVSEPDAFKVLRT